jgi:hypothetical protein
MQLIPRTIEDARAFDSDPRIRLLRRPGEIIGRFMEIARVRERLLLHDVRSG